MARSSSRGAATTTSRSGDVGAAQVLVAEAAKGWIGAGAGHEPASDMTDTPPIALTIAGSDPSGGAGIQADLKTFAAHGVYGASVVTALTAQNTLGVTGIHGVPPGFVLAQGRAVLDDLDVAAIKVGMLGDVATIEAVESLLHAAAGVPVVLDPVMVAASGDSLLADDAAEALRARLVPLATVVTPNVHEARLLLGRDVADGDDGLRAAARALLGLGAAAALVKGGRARSPETSNDVLATREGETILRGDRVPIERPHGTGCTLSSAIAAHLARGAALEDAVEAAKAYVTLALGRGARARIGGGSRPLIH